MLRLIGIITLIFSVNISATIPTVEGLFRNLNNPDATGNLILLKVKIEESEAQPIIGSTKISEFSEDELEATLSDQQKEVKPVYLKFLISLERDKYIDVLQARYKNSVMSKANLMDVKYFPALDRTLNDERDIKRQVLYSFILMLAANSSTAMSQFLKTNNSDYLSNKELMNQEKVSLFKRYIRHLENSKGEEEENKENNSSPLSPESDEAKEKVKEILSKPMYQPNDKVQLVSEKEAFYWKVLLSNTTATFNSSNFRIEEFSFNSSLGSLNLNFINYVLFDGLHELPKDIFFTNFQGKVFKIQTLGVTHLKSKNHPISKRFSEYKKDLAKSKSTEEEGPNYSFIY